MAGATTLVPQHLHHALALPNTSRVAAPLAVPSPSLSRFVGLAAPAPGLWVALPPHPHPFGQLMVVMKSLNLVGVPDDRMERLAHPEGFSPAGLKVLVVDDDLLCLMILERMLRQCKYAGKSQPPRPSSPPFLLTPASRISLLLASALPRVCIPIPTHDRLFRSPAASSEARFFFLWTWPSWKPFRRLCGCGGSSNGM